MPDLTQSFTGMKLFGPDENTVGCAVRQTFRSQIIPLSGRQVACMIRDGYEIQSYGLSSQCLAFCGLTIFIRIIGEGPVEIPVDDPNSKFLVKWKSSLEYGDVACVRLFRGDSSTGGYPDNVWEIFPLDYEGADESMEVSSFLSVPGENVYFRVQAYTYDPYGSLPVPGDVSNVSYDTVVNDYQYCAYTNPIWITAGDPVPTPTPEPVNTPTPIPTNTPVCINDGDVDQNDVLTSGDSQLAFQIALFMFTPTDEERCAADCNGSGTVTADDAQNIFLAALEMGSCNDPM